MSIRLSSWVLLLPPDLRDWLPEGHLAWFMWRGWRNGSVRVFYRPYRHDGHGRPAHDPQMMVALLLYAYCKGQRSSRVIERECVEDVAYWVIAADGTKVHANASQHAARDYEQIAKEILEEAAETDRLEDERYGEKRGDELPPELSTEQGRRGWLREAKRRLDEKRAAEAEPIPRSCPERLSPVKAPAGGGACCRVCRERCL